MKELYPLFFNLLKTIENGNDPRKSGTFTFSAHGKTSKQNLTFRLIRGSNEHGHLKWTPMLATAGNSPAADNVIIDDDIKAVSEQCEKLNFNPYWSERVVALFKGVQGLNLHMPVFNVKGYYPSWSSRNGYALSVVGYLHDDDNQPIGEVELMVTAFPMSQHEQTLLGLEKMRNQSEAEAETRVRLQSSHRSLTALAASAAVIGTTPRDPDQPTTKVAVIG